MRRHERFYLGGGAPDDDKKSEGDGDKKDSKSGEATVSKAEFDALQAKFGEQQKALEKSTKDLDTAKGYLKTLIEKVKEGEATKEEASFVDRFNEDPEKALDEIVGKRVGPLVSGYFDTAAKTARELASSKLGKTWEKYGDAIDKFMEGMSPEIRAQPEAWIKAAGYIRADKIDDEVEERIKEKAELEKKSAFETASPAMGGRAPRKGLNAEEKRIAEALEVSEEDYMAMRDKMIADPVRGRAALPAEARK